MPETPVESAPRMAQRARPAAVATVESIGEPTDLEQLLLEKLNHARLHPELEAIRLRDVTDVAVLQAYAYFQVNLDVVVSGVAGMPPVAPLKFHPVLLEVARGHSRFLFDRVDQTHDEDGRNVADRITGAGYPAAIVGENVYSTGETPEHIHAGFEVDWGLTPGTGVQDPPGHRLNNHSGEFTEVGIGVVEGRRTLETNGVVRRVGPHVVTVDFSAPRQKQGAVTGVAYFDLNRNGAYDVGEGVGGLQVRSPGSGREAVTARSGGYALTLPPGTHEVHFEGSGLSERRTVTVEGVRNVKLDLVANYREPEVRGPATAAVGLFNRYDAVVVPGVPDYRWRISARSPYLTTLGAENGSEGMDVATGGDYPLTVQYGAAAGRWAYHLAHPLINGGAPAPQSLRIQGRFRGGSAPLLRFASRLGFATSNQVARVQRSIDDALSWRDVWIRRGTGDAGQLQPAIERVALAGTEGREFELRFLYEFEALPGAQCYHQTDDGIGWYLDEIGLEDTEILDRSVEVSVEGESRLAWKPGRTGEYAIVARGNRGTRIYPWGPSRAVTVGNFGAVSSFSLVVESSADTSGASFEIALKVESGLGGPFVIESARTLPGPWGSASAVPLGEGLNGVFRFRVPGGGSMQFLRARIP